MHVELTISPNPATTESILQYELPKGEQAEVRIFGPSGKKHAQIPLEKMAGTISLPAYQAGIYFVVLFVDGKVVGSQKYVRY